MLYYADMDCSMVIAAPRSVSAQVALDDRLLREVGAGTLPPVVRIWQCMDEAVVVGVAQKPEAVADLDACRADGIPVLKRFSGGGAVFIGRGCVVYSAIVRLGGAVMRHDVEGAYRHVLGPVIAGFAAAGVPIEFQPPSDLASAGRKIAGNAQAQRRGAVLVHGSFLVNADLDRIARYLPEPAVAPEYRAGRRHAAFLRNLAEDGLDSGRVGGLLMAAWSPAGTPVKIPVEAGVP